MASRPTTRASTFRPFGFVDLPPEIRNLIYRFCVKDSKQALVVQRPRRGSLRSLYRSSNRPSVNLTQVNRQIRAEFLPLYSSNQEIGINLTDVVKFTGTFYDPSQLTPQQRQSREIPFFGNLIITISRVPKSCERGDNYTEMWPLLWVWANSENIKAGFGRYAGRFYNPQVDGEAKDLYRLFGFEVLDEGACGPMNMRFGSYLRRRDLASVRVYREPPVHQGWYFQPSMFPNLIASRMVYGNVCTPYFHLLFRPDRAEPWMMQGNIPGGWLREHGFSDMKHFTVKVGVLLPDGSASN